MLRLLIYEDNDKLRDSLRILFEVSEDIEVAAALGNCNRAKQDIAEHNPDVVLMDIDMPVTDGIEGVKVIKGLRPDVHILMHTVFDDDEKIFKSLSAGADGYLLKKSSPLELYDALKNVLTGGAPMSPGVAKKVLESFRQPVSPEATTLSNREKDILTMLTKGYTYKRIAAEAFISIDTVRTHLKNIYTKLHVNCGTEAVAKALKLKIVEL